MGVLTNPLSASFPSAGPFWSLRKWKEGVSVRNTKLGILSESAAETAEHLQEKDATSR